MFSDFAFQSLCKNMVSKFRPPKDVLVLIKKSHDFKLIRLRGLILKNYSEKDALRVTRSSLFSLHFYLRFFKNIFP